MRAILLLVCAALAAGAQDTWYMRETAMSSDGRLTFLDKPWWPRAKALAEGERFTLDLNGDGRPDTIVTRRDGNIVEAIDDSGKAAEIWNEASTAYVVSFKGTGVVDRMIVYIDNNGDGKADEMELRHYQDGHLRYAWFGENYDNDGVRIFDLKNWSYVGNNGRNKFRGNLQIYLNKYDPASSTWVPLSECPFAFWDYNQDGHGDIALRVSAAPFASINGRDTDYANNYTYMWGETATPLAETGNLNVRFSFNLDPGRRTEPLDKPHYTFGFTMLGAQPYQYPGMRYTNPRRRPPQTVIRVAWQDGVRVGMEYPAKETAFSWDEARTVFRWEGQFFIFERIFIPNTGGPTMRWNMRREYSPKPADRRRLYYSEADRRYHLRDATEGWMETGHLVNQTRDLEYRWFDADGDGYLDTTHILTAGSATPVYTASFRPRAREVALDRDALIAEYNGRVLPGAIDANRRLIAQFMKSVSDPLAEAYRTEGERAATPDRRRYCLDVARDLYFLKYREWLYSKAEAGPYPRGPMNPKARTLDKGSPGTGYTLGDSVEFWSLVRQAQRFSVLYADGEFDEAMRVMETIQ